MARGLRSDRPEANDKPEPRLGPGQQRTRPRRRDPLTGRFLPGTLRLLAPTSDGQPGVLVDENLDVRLVASLTAALGPRVHVSSCHARGWLGVRDASLLDAMADAGLQVLVTADGHLWQQRRAQLARLRIGVVLVREPRTALDRVDAIADAVRRLRPGQLVEVAT